MNRIKFALVLMVAVFALLLFAGVVPSSASSPSGAPPTVVLPTPVAKPTQPTNGPITAPTRAVPATAPTRAPSPTIALVKAPKSVRGGYGTAWTTSLTYQNIGSAATTNIQIQFYASPSVTSPTSVTRANLNSFAASSLFIGSLDNTVVPSGFGGSAVLIADQPIAATLVQVPQSSPDVINRPLSNGFSAGGPQSLIATVLKNTFGFNTKFSVQNMDSVANTATIDFYNTSATKVHTIVQNIEAGAAYFVDAGTISQLGTSFNGSVVATGKRADNSNGNIVSTALELEIAGVGAKAFEGIAAGATKLYMPSALCQYGPSSASTAYAVQNTNLSTSTNVTVNYSNGVTQMKPVGPGAKASFLACDVTSPGFIGSATLQSTGSISIASIGKALDNTGMGTAFVGFASGNSKLSLPYVRWANDTNYNNGTQQRTFIAIQNIGSSDLAASSIQVKYYKPDGTLAGTHTISTALPVGQKANSNASMAGLSEFGFTPTFGGAAIVEGPGGSQLAVIARVQTQVAANQFVAEDYNGIPVQ